MLSWLSQLNIWLVFSGMVQRALKSSYSKITGAGLYPLTESQVNIHQAHAYSWYDMIQILRGKQDGQLNGEVFFQQLRLYWKEMLFKQEVLIAASVPA